MFQTRSNSIYLSQLIFYQNKRLSVNWEIEINTELKINCKFTKKAIQAEWPAQFMNYGSNLYSNTKFLLTNKVLSQSRQNACTWQDFFLVQMLRYGCFIISSFSKRWFFWHNTTFGFFCFDWIHRLETIKFDFHVQIVRLHRCDLTLVYFVGLNVTEFFRVNKCSRNFFKWISIVDYFQCIWRTIMLLIFGTSKLLCLWFNWAFNPNKHWWPIPLMQYLEITTEVKSSSAFLQLYAKAYDLIFNLHLIFQLFRTTQKN